MTSSIERSATTSACRLFPAAPTSSRVLPSATPSPRSTAASCKPAVWGWGWRSIDDERSRRSSARRESWSALRPFPSMPVAFWNDPDGCQVPSPPTSTTSPASGATATGRRSRREVVMIIYGRSDATLNPRGSADWNCRDLSPGRAGRRGGRGSGGGPGVARRRSDRALRPAARGAGPWATDLRRHRCANESGAQERLTPPRTQEDPPGRRHPPYPLSGKITELAVRDILHGRPVKNTDALANPEALKLFENLPQLAD